MKRASRAVLVLVVASCAWPALAQDGGVPYEVSFTGIEDPELQTILRDVADTVTQQERPPASMAILRRRAGNDLPKLRDALHSLGYYASEVDLAIADDADPVRIQYTVSPGPQYTMSEVDVAWQGAPPSGEAAEATTAITLKEGDPALARNIIENGNGILRYLQRYGHPYPQLVNRDVIVDHATTGVSVTYQVDAGPLARFGPVNFDGLETVDAEYLERQLPWERGEPYSVAEVNEARRIFAQLGLFASFSIDPAEEVPESGELPVTIHVEEAKHRTIAAGVSASTDDGVGVFLSWEHRNFTGRGDTFRAEARVSSLRSHLRTTYSLAEFRRPDQSLDSIIEIAQEDLEAYESQHFLAEASIKRQLSPRITISGGLGLKTAKVEQEEEESTYVLAYSPWKAWYDTRDESTNPSSGGLLTLNVTPYLGSGDADPFFLKTHAEYARYLGVSENLTLAARAALGAIWVAPQDGIPPDERYYSGGGSSVRGYEYRTLAPLEDDVPIGGRSIVEVSFEARRRITEAMGLVLFLDGGGAFESVYPDFGTELRWGAGVGLRFYTPAGPMRIDVAVPINPRDEIDDAFQIYASFGHTF